MGFSFFAQARAFFDRRGDDPRVADLRRRLAASLSQCRLAGTLELYGELLDLAEALFWEEGATEEELERLQALHREHEHLIVLAGEERRHRFVVVIPVADRPRQLEACLQSLLALCRAFEYGGVRQGRYPAVRVVVADDSGDSASIRRHADLAARFGQQGLEVIHFHPHAQRRLLDELPEDPRLEPALGALPLADLGRKGASRMRNLVYLHLARMAVAEPRSLFLFVDSDESFEVLHCDASGARRWMAVNYFHHLDRIFSLHRPVVVTGKVVGDPPVAPAVMAGNLLEDLLAFLQRVGEGAADDPCGFHDVSPGAEGAAYHDMADLFGFRQASRPHSFPCPLRGAHDQLEVLREFARRLDRFFDGEHPTRLTCYRHRPVMESLQPARTVYTGNYAVSAEGLLHFIPFADLGLRMAGPVLGRLLRTQEGDGFLSANLPLMHKRTLEERGASEFRPGVERRRGKVDLAGEIERQFHGDLMLFSVERLTDLGYPEKVPGEPRVREVVEAVFEELARRYGERRREVVGRLAAIRRCLEDPDRWWHGHAGAGVAVEEIRRFLDNMDDNFGRGASPPVPCAESPWVERIVAAIRRHPEACAGWRTALHRLGRSAGEGRAGAGR